MARDILKTLKDEHDLLRSLFEELKGYWKEWEAAEEAGNEQQRRRVVEKMVDLLNRRSYVRNLVRDVNEALQSSA